MNSSVKKAAEKLLNRFPLKDILIFESVPDFSDNARAVFDECLRQGLNKKYTLVWATHEKKALPAELQGLDNVKAVREDSPIYKYYYSYFAKALLPCNWFLQKRRKEQYYLFLAHGAAFKGIKDHRYTVPPDCYGCDFAAYSDYIGEYDIANLSAAGKVNIAPLGYARNDLLFGDLPDVKALFARADFERLIYWMPTFRQKANDTGATKYTSVSVPFIHDKAAAEQINRVAKENNTLLVLKPHPAQDVSFLKDYSLSHILFIDNAFLAEHGVTNYGLLGASDALLTDYSSVYYDYLLLDRPIGLCWEDFEEYKEREGFILDPDFIMAGGEKLYTPDDLCRFIADVSSGRDTLQEERDKIKALIHTNPDGRSCERTVQHLLKHI